MKFIDYVEKQDRMYNEMAGKKKKPQPVQMPKEDDPQVIKGELGNIGHQNHMSGVGVWNQKKPGNTGNRRRQQTRASRNNAAIKDQS